MSQNFLAQHCLEISSNQNELAAPFFIDEDGTHSYEDFLTLVKNLSYRYQDKQEKKVALKIASPYFFFANLLALIFAKKEIIILSHLEPQKSIDEIINRLNIDSLIEGTIAKTNNEALVDFFSQSLERKNNETILNILSSGSSGPQKCIAHTFSTLFHSAQSFINFFECKDKKETTFANLPHSHIGGLMIFWRAFFAKASLTNLIEQKIDIISIVPLQLAQALDDNQNPFYEILKKARVILVGGGALEDHLRQKAKNEGLKTFETYGMSETASFVIIDGRPLPNQEIKLDEHGHFMIRGLTLSPSAKTDDEGFFKTNDVARF